MFPLFFSSKTAPFRAVLLDPRDVLLLSGALSRGLWPWRDAAARAAAGGQQQPQPQRLLCATFASARAFPAAGYAVPAGVAPPGWLAELSPAQQSVCKARFTGAAGGGGGGGGESELPAAAAAAAAAAPAGQGGPDHCHWDPEEHWFWDLTGILVLKGVMGQAWLGHANGALVILLPCWHDILTACQTTHNR
eukprot:SAG22_NODE_994_length_6119_cov_167.397674_2_plen_192_part_00